MTLSLKNYRVPLAGLGCGREKGECGCLQRGKGDVKTLIPRPELSLMANYLICSYLSKYFNR